MVQIRYMNRSGDQTQQVTVQKAQEIITEELDSGNIVYDEDERKVVEKATMGQLKSKSKIAIFPVVAGG